MLALRDDCLDSKDTVSGRILLPLFVDVKHLSEVDDTPLFSGLIKYFGNDITDGKTILSFFKKGAESEKYAYLIIVDLLLNQVALVELTSTDQDNNFSFQHQILRDMLAAVHIINVIRYSNNYSELEITVDDNILLFVGELFKDKNGLSECDFKKFYEENNKQLKPPIEDFLREKREKLKKHPVAIRNIVEIIKISREHTLDNIDLSNLNLSLCPFINVSLKSANLSNTTISNNTFSTLELSFLPKILYADSKIIVGEVIEYLKSETTIVGFSTKTGHIVYSLTICKKHNCKISFINNKNIVCVVQGDETSVVVRDLYTGEIIKRFHVNDIISSQGNENVVIQCSHIHDTQNLVVLAYNNSINKEILTIYNINSGATSEHCAPFEKNSLTTEKNNCFFMIINA